MIEPVPERHFRGALFLRLNRRAKRFLECVQLLLTVLLRLGEDVFRLGQAVLVVADDHATLPSMKPPTMPEAASFMSSVTWV